MFHPRIAGIELMFNPHSIGIEENDCTKQAAAARVKHSRTWLVRPKVGHSCREWTLGQRRSAYENPPLRGLNMQLSGRIIATA